MVDLRSVKPLDIDTVLASVARTGRLLALGEAFPWGGVTAEVIARDFFTIRTCTVIVTMNDAWPRLCQSVWQGPSAV